MKGPSHSSSSDPKKIKERAKELRKRIIDGRLSFKYTSTTSPYLLSEVYEAYEQVIKHYTDKYGKEFF